MKFPSYFASFCGFISFAGFASAQSPTDISFSGSTVSGAANVGSLAGSFTTTDPTAGDTFSYSFVEGSGDTHNGRFDIQSDQLFVDRDLSSFPSESFLTIRVRTTDASANFFEKEFSLQIVNDSDSDGLDDSWELTYFPDLTTVSGSDNSDSDTLDNLAEQAAGTDPTLTDTDTDGLDDNVEPIPASTTPQSTLDPILSIPIPTVTASTMGRKSIRQMASSPIPISRTPTTTAFLTKTKSRAATTPPFQPTSRPDSCRSSSTKS